MKSDFALDLSAARRKAGYVQSDLAHLLGSSQSRVSDLEHGNRLPELKEIVTLSVIFGKSFESLFGAVMKEAKDELRTRVKTLPDDVRRYAGTFNRDASVERLVARLSDNDDSDGGA